MSGAARETAGGGRAGRATLPGDDGGRAGRATLPGAAPGWVCEDGVWRRETIHSMLRRLPGWDYTQPWIYQITIVCADRGAALLGRLEVRRREAGRPEVAPYPAGWLSVAAARAAREPYRPEEIEARVVPSAIGEIVLKCWREIAEQWPGVSVIGEQLMPEHFHGIIHIKEPQAKPLGSIIGSFKSKSTSRVRQLLAARGAGEDSPASGREPDGSGGFCPPSLAAEFRLWSEGFQDSILFHAGQLDNMFGYLADNARRRAIKALWPDLFRVVGRLGVDLWLSPREKARGWFMALGNRFLLGRPLAQIQVSRRDFAYKRVARPHAAENQTGPHAAEDRTKIVRDEKGAPIAQFSSPAFSAKKAALMLAAKRGAVLLSPCVSDGEREIARLALAAELPLVALKNKGFSPLGKPSGRLFEACSAGRLLLLAPAAWPYTPGEKPMTRLDAVAMNRLCQMIADAGAAQVNYHGMKPANIDALAFAAAEVEKS